LAQKFKALFESIESRHCEERYKNSFYIMWKITNELGLLLAMLC
jgi:hypothetical protein